MIKARYNRKGFTLAEAMIAMVILAMAASGAILPFSSGAAVQAEGARRTLAAKLAADRLEEMINSDFDMLIPNYEGDYQPEGFITDGNGTFFTDPAYGKFVRYSNCTPAKVGDVDLIWATVAIRYGGDKMLELSTLIGP
jgi:prepilin-type N-terminal cleavage/methylation domain-containing protein